jgi:hypothetical protein
MPNRWESSLPTSFCTCVADAELESTTLPLCTYVLTSS